MCKFLLRRKIKQIVERSDRKKAYYSLREIKSVLVLFDTKDFEDADRFIQQLKRMRKSTKAFAFKDKKDTNTYSKISYPIVTEKDMKSLSHESLIQMANSLSNESIDLIVDFTLKENLLLLFLLVSVNASLKIGFYRHALPVHDLVILFAPDRVLNVRELGEQVFHYLTVIASAG